MVGNPRLSFLSHLFSVQQKDIHQSYLVEALPETITKIPAIMYSTGWLELPCPISLAVKTDWQMTTRDPMCMTRKRYLIQNMVGNMKISIIRGTRLTVAY